MKVRIDKTKEILKKIKEQTELVTLNETIYNMDAKVKNFIFNESIGKINETKNSYMEEIQKYKDIQKMSERLKFLFESRKKHSEKRIENAKKLSQKISEKAKSLDVEKLNDIVDKLNKMNERIIEPINGTLVEEQLNKLIEKFEENEKLIMSFPTAENQTKYDKAVDDAKKKLLDHTPKEIVERLHRMFIGNLDTLNYTTNIIRLIVLRYKNKPEDVTPEEFTQNITDLISNEFDKLEVPDFEIKNKEILKDIKDRLEKRLSNTEIPKLNENIQKAIENLKTELGSFKEVYANKTLLEINDAIQKEIKGLNVNGLLDNQLNKLKEIQNKMQDALKKTNLNKLKDVASQLKVINDQSKKQIDTFISRIEKLNEKLKALPKSKALNRTLTAIKKLTTRLNFQKTIELLKSINISEINPKQEIDNIKRIKSLTDEIKEIMDSSPLINVFGQILFQNLNRKLSEKKKRTLQADVVREMICKMDNVPSSDSITLEPQLLNQYELNNEVYDISTDSQLKLDFNNDDLARCSQNKIPEVYNNVVYNGYSDIEVDPQKKRVKYKLKAKYLRDYQPPEFFYLNIQSKLTYNNEQIDTDSYCVVEDDSDRDNVIFNCYTYLDSVDGEKYELAEINSNYIEIPKNSTDNTPRNYGNSYFRTSKNSLSAGAIVGIILGCVAALAIIAGVALCLKSSAKATVYPTQSINTSANIIVPNEAVDYSNKNFKI